MPGSHVQLEVDFHVVVVADARHRAIIHVTPDELTYVLLVNPTTPGSDLQ